MFVIRERLYAHASLLFVYFIWWAQWFCHHSKSTMKCSLWYLTTASCRLLRLWWYHWISFPLITALNLVSTESVKRHFTLSQELMWIQSRVSRCEARIWQQLARVRLSWKMPWIDPNYIPNMLGTSQIVIFLFWMEGKFLHSIHSFICLAHQ
jgi:hypothetical protein